jgi:N-acetylmuramoyl-L-alanine amidase
MFKSMTIIFGAAIFLAGCATQPALPPETVSPPPMSDEMSSLNWAAPGALHKPLAPAVPSNPPSVIVPKPAPATSLATWTSLDRWAAEHKIGAPHQVSELPVSTYAVGSSNGVMVLEIGSRDATWNGVEIDLGFAPEFIDGEVFMSGLDLQKNLKPLLCDPPLTFPQTNRVIVIDPGHGGANTGTHSVLDGRFEKEFTLDWAKRIKPLLEQEGWTVFLTRDSDVYVTNSDRVVFANSHHADLFVSLHFNSGAPDTKQNGLETYCFTPTGMPSTLTRGYEDNWSENLPNNAFDAQNLQLAVKMHSALVHAIGMEDRGVRRARFIEVLRGQECPAILIEGGYLSNPAEARKIESADYRQKLAEAFATALRQNEGGK